MPRRERNIFVAEGCDEFDGRIEPAEQGLAWSVPPDEDGSVQRKGEREPIGWLGSQHDLAVDRAEPPTGRRFGVSQCAIVIRALPPEMITLAACMSS